MYIQNVFIVSIFSINRLNFDTCSVSCLLIFVYLFLSFDQILDPHDPSLFILNFCPRIAYKYVYGYGTEFITLFVLVVQRIDHFLFLYLNQDVCYIVHPHLPTLYLKHRLMQSIVVSFYSTLLAGIFLKFKFYSFWIWTFYTNISYLITLSK